MTDVVNPDDVVCPHCGKTIDNVDLFKNPVYPFHPGIKNIGLQQPREITYYIDHRVDVTLPGSFERVEAAREAIRYVREYMKTLPEDYRLKQACPKRFVTLDEDGPKMSHWVVRCIMWRRSKTNDMGWADLLDGPEEGEPY